MIDGWVIERDDGRFFSISGWVAERHAAITFGFRREANEAIIEHRRSQNPLFCGERSYCSSLVMVDDAGRTVAYPDSVESVGVR